MFLIPSLVRKLEDNKSSYIIFFIFSFLIGLIPAVSFIHMFAKDFVGYYLISESFSNFGSYAFVHVLSYETSKEGLQARAPFLPALISISRLIFGETLLALYIPIFISRILITPLTYLISSHFLPLPIAFFASTLTIFFPKLQTFSLSAFEADGLVLVLFLLSILLFLKYLKERKSVLLGLTGISLGLLTLTKEVGLPIAVGFITGVLLEQVLIRRPKSGIDFKHFIHLTFPFIILVLPFFAFTLLKQGNLYFSALTTDRSPVYLAENLPILMQTIPYYIGIDSIYLHTLSIKSFVTNFSILLFLTLGFVYFVLSRKFLMFLPIIVTIFSLGLLNKTSLGGDIPWNMELITIFAFAMPIAAIFIFKGLLIFIDAIAKKFSLSANLKSLIYLTLSLILVGKFVNNFFSKPYTLDFAGDYYVSIVTVAKDERVLPKHDFEKDDQGNLVVSDLSPLLIFMKNEYRNDSTIVFDKNFRLALFAVISIATIYALFELYNFRLKPQSKSKS